MNRFLRSFILLFVAAFTLNVVASPVLAANRCNTALTASFAQAGEVEMPCHDVANTEKDAQQAGCEKCCDYCKLMSSALLPAGPDAAGGAGKPASVFSLENTPSFVPYGIEYPPRPIS